MMKVLMPYIKIARLDHWIKNIFIFPGIFFAFLLIDKIVPHYIYNLIVGTVAICLVASANYTINEWLDAPYDRFHPIKKNRPSVTGGVTKASVYTEYAAFAAIGFFLGQTVNKLFLLSLLWLLVMGILYNVQPMRTKDIVILDVLSESVNNVIRFLLGWAMLAPAVLPPSSIILSYWMGGAFLMAVKRLAEYRFISDATVASQYRKSFKHYTEPLLLVTILFYAMCSFLFLGIFLIKYKIEMIISLPFFALLFCWYFSIGLRRDSIAQHPEHLYKEPMLFLYTIFLFALVTVLLVVDIPALKWFLSKAFLSV